jgi:hypothetical protein
MKNYKIDLWNALVSKVDLIILQWKSCQIWSYWTGKLKNMKKLKEGMVEVWKKYIDFIIQLQIQFNIILITHILSIEYKKNRELIIDFERDWKWWFFIHFYYK